MPIIVGGTNYYIESIVYKILVEDMDDDKALLWETSRRKRDYNDYESGNTKRIAIENKEESNPGPSLTTTKESGKESVGNSKDTVKPQTQDRSENINTLEKVEDKSDNIKQKLKEFVDNEKKYSNEEVHAELKAIDPVMAARLHPNNRRKILR